MPWAAQGFAVGSMALQHSIRVGLGFYAFEMIVGRLGVRFHWGVGLWSWKLSSNFRSIGTLAAT